MGPLASLHLGCCRFCRELTTSPSGPMSVPRNMWGRDSTVYVAKPSVPNLAHIRAGLIGFRAIQLKWAGCVLRYERARRNCRDEPIPEARQGLDVTGANCWSSTSRIPPRARRTRPSTCPPTRSLNGVLCRNLTEPAILAGLALRPTRVPSP
jgi:hypothetical protein